MNPTIGSVAQLVRDIGLAFFVLAVLGFFHRTSEDLRAIRRLLEKKEGVTRK